MVTKSATGCGGHKYLLAEVTLKWNIVQSSEQYVKLQRNKSVDIHYLHHTEDNKIIPYLDCHKF